MTSKKFKKLARANARANGTSHQSELDAIARTNGHSDWGSFQAHLKIQEEVRLVGLARQRSIAALRPVMMPADSLSFLKKIDLTPPPPRPELRKVYTSFMERDLRSVIRPVAIEDNDMQSLKAKVAETQKLMDELKEAVAKARKRLSKNIPDSPLDA